MIPTIELPKRNGTGISLFTYHGQDKKLLDEYAEEIVDKKIFRIDVIRKENNKFFAEDEVKRQFTGLLKYYEYFCFKNYCVLYRFDHFPKKKVLDIVSAVNKSPGVMANYRILFQRVYNSKSPQYSGPPFYISFPGPLSFCTYSELNDFLTSVDCSSNQTIYNYGGKKYPKKPSENLDESEMSKYNRFYTLLYYFKDIPDLNIKILHVVAQAVGLPSYHLNKIGCRLLKKAIDQFIYVYDPENELLLPNSLTALSSENTDYFDENNFFIVDNHFVSFVDAPQKRTTGFAEKIKNCRAVAKRDVDFGELLADKNIEAIYDNGNSLITVYSNPVTPREGEREITDVYKVYLVNFPLDIEMTALFHLFDDYSPVSIERGNGNYFILYVNQLENARRVCNDFKINVVKKEPQNPKSLLIIKKHETSSKVDKHVK
jgi:hypothetical protein